MSLHQSREEAAKLISLLDDKALKSLFSTVCGPKIPFNTSDEAIEMIIRISQLPEELLNRAKITKEILFKYLIQEKVDISLQKSDKNTLVFLTLKHWKSKRSSMSSLSTIASRAVQNTGSRPDVLPRAPQGAFSAGAQGMTYNIVNNVVINQAPAAQTPPPTPTQSLDVVTSHSPHPLQGMKFTQLAKQFAEWFYKMLNNCNPCMGVKSDFGPSHFFPDCWMKCVIITDGNVQENEEKGVDVVGQRLLHFVQNEGVLFNPHLDVGGTASKNNAYGVTVVQVCGTLHKNQDVVGVFEQRFGIIKDPSMNFNWRIKFSHLCAKVGTPSEQPALGGQMTTLLPLSEN